MIPGRTARRTLALATLVLAWQVAALPPSATVGAAARDFLWKVNGSRGAIYLVGSVHILSGDYYPLSPALEAAFKDSDVLVEEVDLGEMESSDAQLQMLTRGMLPADQPLDKVLSSATYALVTRRIGELGLPIEPLKQFKPWMLALTLDAMEWQKAGFDPEHGIDKHFYDRARKDGRQVQGLETVEFQISRFDGMSMDQQDRFLADTLKELDTEIGNLTKMAQAWKSGDVATIERITLADLKSDPVTYQRFLVERNRNWLPKIEALFNRSGHAFVVVGAAHLIGPDGLLALLKARGYAIEQL